MDAASLFSSGNLYYVNEEYEEALKHHTCAVTLQDCAEYRACRAATYLRLGKFPEALEDAAEAMKFDAGHHMAMHWKGIALFYSGDFGNAKASFEESVRASPNARAPRAIWIRKCDAELSGSTLPLGSIAAEMSKTAAPTSAEEKVTTVAPVEPKDDPPQAAAAGDEKQEAPRSEGGTTISGRKPLKREWYQSNTHVYLSIFAKGVSQEQCKVNFEEREISIMFPLPGSSDEEYHLDLELFDNVEPAQCSVEVSKVKVEVMMAKKTVGLQWKDLEKKEVLPEAPPGQPAYPTSSKQKRDWSQIDRDVENELKNEKPEGDAALNKLFREIYDRADEDTRRAMNKSFQTSGGTVLSTNWGEVARSDYEGKDRPTAPDGQEWRDWKPAS